MRNRGIAIGIAALLTGSDGCSANTEKLGDEETAPSSTGQGGSGNGPASSGNGNTGGLSLGGSGGGTGTPSCQYVDVLFLIDNSPSMGDPQEKLATQWPSFVDAMFDHLPPNVDLHVGITTSSFFVGSCSESTVNCATAQTPAEVSAHFTPPDQDNGENGGQGRLYEFEGKRWFGVNTSDEDRDPFKHWFSGAATAAGETGCSYEFPTAGVANTASAANAATNQGFYRDEDAVLLIIVLSDEPDKSFEGVPKYHDMITSVKTKCGGDKCILTAGLIDPCVVSSNQTLWQFMSAFGEMPIWGDIGGVASDYSQVVGDALAQVVKSTCDEIGTPK